MFTLDENERIILENGLKINKTYLKKIFNNQYIFFTSVLLDSRNIPELEANKCNYPIDYTISKDGCTTKVPGRYFCDNIRHFLYAMTKKLKIYTNQSDVDYDLNITIPNKPSTLKTELEAEKVKISNNFIF
jgi:hypothetical protein